MNKRVKKTIEIIIEKQNTTAKIGRKKYDFGKASDILFNKGKEMKILYGSHLCLEQEK